MGFRRKTYRLEWPDDSPWSGLEVRLKGLTIGQLEEINVLRGQAANRDDDEFTLGVSGPILDIMGSALLSWNLEDEQGKPVPLADFRGEDSGMLLSILNAWTEAVTYVPAPLSDASDDGKPSEEALIPMEIPSSSQLSSNTPN